MECPIYESKRAGHKTVVIAIPDMECGYNDFEIDYDVFMKIVSGIKNGADYVETVWEHICSDCIARFKIRAEIGGSIVRFHMMTSYSSVPWTNQSSFYAYCTDMLEFADNYALTH